MVHGSKIVDTIQNGKVKTLPEPKEYHLFDVFDKETQYEMELTMVRPNPEID